MPGTGSSGDGSCHLLILQKLDVQIFFGRPSGAGNVPQSGRGEVKRRLSVGECTDDARAPSDLAQDPLERIIIWHVLIDAIIHSLGGRISAA